jgi:tetratricopeptide (TPR) repeat protein
MNFKLEKRVVKFYLLLFFCIFAEKHRKMGKFLFWVFAGLTTYWLTSCQQEGKSESQGGTQKDSDEYYIDLSLRNIKFYEAYAVDSFLQTTERIHQYLLRNEKRMNRDMQLLRAQWMMARGVYYAALLGRPDSGLVYAKKAAHLMEQERMNPDLRVVAMTDIADFYRQTGQLDLSAEGYMQALAVADSFQTTTDSHIAISLGISTVYTFMADYENSAKWWAKCKELLPKMKKPDQFIYYNNVGNDYYLQDKYQEALPCFEKAASLVKDDPDKTWDYYTARANIAEILINLKRGDDARPILEEVDSFYRKVHFPILLYYINTSKIELALLDGRTADAIRIIREEKAPEEMIPAAKVMRLKVVEQVWTQAGNIQNAYETHKELHALNDSIQTANVRMQLSTRLMEYEHDKRLLEQQQEIEHSKMTNRLAWVLFVTALLTAILLFVLYLMHRRKGRMQALELRQQLIETRLKNTRNRISPHFIYNALNHEMLAQMDGKAVDFNALTQLLRRGLAMADTLETTLAEELAFVDYYVTIEGQQMGDTFHYEKVISDGIDTSQVKLPAMTIQIFVENAIKHGLRSLRLQEGQLCRLTIRVSRKDECTLVEVVDNGGGLKSDLSNKAQTGIKVVRQTIQMLNEHNHSSIQFGIGNRLLEGEKGCCSWLLLPDHYSYTIV